MNRQGQSRGGKRKTAQIYTNLIVRISQIESRLLNISGIIDIANTKINGLAENFTLGTYNIPTLGTIQAN